MHGDVCSGRVRRDTVGRCTVWHVKVRRGFTLWRGCGGTCRGEVLHVLVGSGTFWYGKASLCGMGKVMSEQVRFGRSR